MKHTWIWKFVTFAMSLTTMAGAALLPFLIVLASPAQATANRSSYQLASPAVVKIDVYDRDHKDLIGNASGVIIDSSGIIVTNDHVISNIWQTQHVLEICLPNGSRFTDVRVLYQDKSIDIAFLSVDGSDLSFLAPSPSSTHRVGDPVMAIGSPYGLERSASDGIISAFRRGTPSDTYPLIQTTAAISPGSSGGALIDDRGRLIGITTASLSSGQNLNFAIPSEYISALYPRALANRQKGVDIRNMNRVVLTTISELLDERRKIAEDNPDSDGAWNDLSQMYQFLSQWDKAEISLRKAISIRSDMGQYHASLAMILIMRSNINAAIASYNRAIEVDSANVPAYEGLSLLYGFMNRFNDAISLLVRAIPISPKEPRLYCALGSSYLRANKWFDALDSYKKAVALDSLHAQGHSGMGEVYLAMQQTEDAVVSFRRAVEIDSRNASFIARLGDAYYSAQSPVDALAAYQESLEISPRQPNVLVKVGGLFSAAKMWDPAEKSFLMALSVDSSHLTSIIGLTNVYVQNGRNSDAEALLLAGLAIHRSEYQLWSLLGMIEFSLEKYSEAIKSLEVATSMDQRDANSLFFLGASYGLTGRTADANQVVRILNGIDTAKARQLSAMLSQSRR
ncbi:MAG: hypothetical protein AUJ18_05360 [Candidatus Hydrogenedentes bacterium CG1_02_42_14]|nr:MAG: hypothetical protein AUJ18_05360 [Candidatus Hydrogenedentes bacterium CG1_02_42_14]